MMSYDVLWSVFIGSVFIGNSGIIRSRTHHLSLLCYISCIYTNWIHHQWGCCIHNSNSILEYVVGCWSASSILTCCDVVFIQLSWSTSTFDWRLTFRAARCLSPCVNNWLIFSDWLVLTSELQVRFIDIWTWSNIFWYLKPSHVGSRSTGILYESRLKEPIQTRKMCGPFTQAIRILIWGVPKMGVPPNHPFIDGFSIMSHPFLGYPHSRKPPYEWYPAKVLGTWRACTPHQPRKRRAEVALDFSKRGISDGKVCGG